MSSQGRGSSSPILRAEPQPRLPLSQAGSSWTARLRSRGPYELVREQTGLDVAITERLVDFEQEGTPYGTVAMTGLVARVIGGELQEGKEGPPVVYPLDDLPAIIPVRVANQRVLDAYLSRRRSAD